MLHFFAPFFERTSREQAIRAAILEAVRRDGKTDIDNVVGVVMRRLGADGLRLYAPGVDPMLAKGGEPETSFEGVCRGGIDCVY